ncbi:hypothetical protein J5N97_005326 [Dioscorea zingiberensis]|uniref:WPP domain-interacting protein 1 n=1 Tax=Dioscorea zingiberensis TaxID=325984 RepID=A0A9D5HRS1_9LILI|nr:hypothetical protein J5N97_005326 [Dioscorea zingiberensis]
MDLADGVEEEQKPETLGKDVNFDSDKVGNDGELGQGSVSVTKAGDFGRIGLTPVGFEPTEDGFGNESPSELMGSPECEVSDEAGSKQAAVKGYGLKKWRRIRRDMNKEGSASVDSGIILKRRLSLAEAPKSRDDNKLKNDSDGEAEIEAEESVASLESRNAGITGMASHQITTGSLGPELELLVTSTGFSVGAESDNSDEWSGKLSAVSAPRLRHETGFGRDRSRVKSSGRGSVHALQQRGQRGRSSAIDISKKISGDQIRFEKENSFSSVESDLRNPSVVFGRRGSLFSNGKHSERPLSFGGEHSDEGQASEEVKENGRNEDLDSDQAEESVKNCASSTLQSDTDPLAESIMLLQVAQEALENEIQKFGEIAKDPIPILDDDWYDQFDETEGTLDAHLIELNEKIEDLEQKLEEASATAKAKEVKVRELEAILTNKNPAKKETGSSGIHFLQEECEVVELELEKLLKKKMEAEIEYLIITRTTQSWKVLVEDQVALFEEQNSLLKNQSQMIIKMKNTENTATMLKEQVEKLEDSCKELLKTEEVLKLQNKTFRYSICFFIQFLMFCIALVLFIVHRLPPSDGFVPT